MFSPFLFLLKRVLRWLFVYVSVYTITFSKKKCTPTNSAKYPVSPYPCQCWVLLYFPSFLVCIKNCHHIFKSLIEVHHLLFMYLLSISFSCEIKLDFVLYLSASGVREPISMDCVNYVSWKRSSDNNDSRPSILQCVQGSPIELW